MTTRLWIGYTLIALFLGLQAFLIDIAYASEGRVWYSIFIGILTAVIWLKALHDIRLGGFVRGFSKGHWQGVEDAKAGVLKLINEQKAFYDVLGAMKELPGWHPGLAGLIDSEDGKHRAKLIDPESGAVLYESKDRFDSLSDLAAAVASDAAILSLDE